MRLLLGLLAYLVAVIALASGAAAILSSSTEPGARQAIARPEPTTTASPRIQAWLERKAEGVAFAEKEKAAAQAERERADALRARLAATPEPIAAPRARDRDSDLEERRAAEREQAARARQAARREARRRLHDFEGAYGYAGPPRRPAYPDHFLTMRDRPSN